MTAAFADRTDIADALRKAPEKPPLYGRVVLGYPIGFSETEPFALSVRRVSSYEQMKPDAERLLAGVTAAPGLYVEDNRNLLAEHTLRLGAEWNWQVDTDIEFQHYVLETMVGMAESGGLKILAASVPIGETYPSCGFRQAGQWQWKPVFPMPQEPTEVDAIATACVLIHRSVYETMADKFGHRWFNRITVGDKGKETVLGEDFSFCLRARECGFTIHCAHVAGLRHWKQMPLTHDAPWPKKGG